MQTILMVNSGEECNMNCKHCYLPYTGVRSPENTLTTVLELQEQGHDVIIAGGETLVDPRYLESYKQAGQNYILTNGLLLYQDKSLFDQLENNGITELRFSLHFGVEDELKSVPERVVRKTIKAAKERDFLVGVNTTITSKNYRWHRGDVQKGSRISS